MKRITCLTIFLLIFFAAGLSFAGIPGTPDKTPAATLIVPFFEVGIDQTQDPVDTLLTVTNILSNIAPVGMASSQKHFHYHVWDISGNPVALYGNETLEGSETWSASMRTLIQGASSAVKTALTDGGFYRGFVTIDVVTGQTTKNPTESGYPFDFDNCLEGFIYYVRLAQGSSNSLDMIPLNWVSNTIESGLYDFYGPGSGDERERIDSTARLCAEDLVKGLVAPVSVAPAPLISMVGCFPLDDIYQVDSRVFLNPALSATTRIILFVWDPRYLGGPSIYCDTHACDSTYAYMQFDEAGNTVVDAMIRLDKAVNIIDVGGSTNGWVSIREIADPEQGRQVYSFSITNAKPSSGASANWDAILESFIIP
jgi:hypothetical protein